MNHKTESAIVFFDGVCHLCNGFIDFLLKMDKHKKLYFSPLQGEAYKSLKAHNKDVDSIVFKQDQIYLKSDAVIKIFMHLGGLWAVAAVFLVLPKSFRDFFYDIVANNRYGWFGKRNECRLPSAEERERFLP